jgi:hypothetical protein
MAFKEWDPETALRRLAEEKSLLDDCAGDPSLTAESILITSAPEVALSMCWLALHSLDERMRLNAGKYVLDKVLPDTKQTDGQDPLEDLYKALSTVTEP